MPDGPTILSGGREQIAGLEKDRKKEEIVRVF
jgi:hypothetical protein